MQLKTGKLGAGAEIIQFANDTPLNPTSPIL